MQLVPEWLDWISRFVGWFLVLGPWLLVLGYWFLVGFDLSWDHMLIRKRMRTAFTGSQIPSILLTGPGGDISWIFGPAKYTPPVRNRFVRNIC